MNVYDKINVAIKNKGEDKYEQDTWNRWGCTHTSQFLNKIKGIAFSYESVFCVANVCAAIVTSVWNCDFNFVNYVEDS